MKLCILRSALVLAVLAMLLPACVLADAPKALLDLTTSELGVKPKNDQATFTRSAEANAPGVVVTVQPGKDGYPGVELSHASGTWDLSAYGCVESRITNLGTQPLNFILQVENADDLKNMPWNAEQVSIKPGATGTVAVTFGYSHGRMRGYSLNTAKVSRVLLLAIKTNTAQVFRVESVSAAGEAGQKPPIDPNSVRTKPKDGVIVGRGVTIDAAKQISSKGNAKPSLEGETLNIEFATGHDDASVSLKPAIGRWDLGNASQVRVKLKNIGKTPVTPAVQLASDKTNTTATVATASPLQPGDSNELVIPFAAEKTWVGMPSAGIWKGELSGEKTGAADVQPGTGTTYASDRTDTIKITAKRDGEAVLLIESIVAESPVAVTPDWLGTRPPVEGEWVKTFDDDFTGTAVDLTKWNNEGPNHWDKVSHWSKNNVIVDGKTARLHYEHKTGFQNDDPTKKETAFTGGYLDTLGKWRQCYGYFEARVKLPTAPGLWPAFWMMPDRGENTPDAPGSKKNRCTTTNGAMEFDIMEQLTIWGDRRYNVAMHWDDYGPQHKSIGTGKIYFEPDKDGFVTTGLLWMPGSAVYYCNGKEIARWEDPRISNVPGYMIVYMPSGGWDNNRLDGSGLPDGFVIDYVRCWQRKDLLSPR